MTPNNTLERTVGQGGRTVRAVALCARGRCGDSVTCGRSTGSLACMGTYRDPLGPVQLWGVRWLVGTFFAVQALFGLITAQFFEFPTKMFFVVVTLSSMIPGFLLGYLVQYKLDRAKLLQHKLTVGLLGLIAVGMTIFAVAAR